MSLPPMTPESTLRAYLAIQQRSHQASDDLAARVLLSGYARSLSPQYGWCLCCGMPWSIVAHHTTFYSKRAGIFALCERCWRDLSSDERLPFYEQLAGISFDRDDWPAVCAAVLKGL